MELISIVTGVFVALGGLLLAIWCLRRVVSWARRQDKKAYVIGAAFAPFIGLGNVSDPDFRIVHEAKQTKKREEDEPGDPPSAEDDDGLELPADEGSTHHAENTAAPPGGQPARDNVP